MFGIQQAITHISSADIKFSSNQELKKLITTTLTRWNFIRGPNEWNEHIYYDDTVAKKTHRIGDDSYIFEVETKGINLYRVSMYVFGQYRRGGSSMEFFENAMDSLKVQLLHPEQEFDKMADCYEPSQPSVKLDFFDTLTKSSSEVEEDLEEEDLDDEGLDDEDLDDEDLDDDDDDDDEEEPEIELKDMTDVQIDEYIESLGRCARDECDEWALNYEGGPILRYSYVTFKTNVIGQTVENITIRGATFNNVTLKNCRFSKIDFYECNFTDVKIKNTKFKKCNFYDCELPDYVKLDANCLISNM